jgi:hypothetical protein
MRHENKQPIQKLRFRDRIAARWQSGRLDRELAAGRSPAGRSAIAYRARWLTELSRRRALADSLRRMIDEVQGGPSRSYVRITPCQRRVKAASAELRRLADQLADPGPVSARGAAQARILLTDGAGPLYDPRCRESLRGHATRAIENLAARDLNPGTIHGPAGVIWGDGRLR